MMDLCLTPFFHAAGQESGQKSGSVQKSGQNFRSQKHARQGANGPLSAATAGGRFVLHYVSPVISLLTFGAVLSRPLFPTGHLDGSGFGFVCLSTLARGVANGPSRFF